MRRKHLLALLPLFLFIAAPALHADEKDLEKRKADLLLRLKVHRAIDRGATWVADRQMPDGSFRLKENKQQGPFPTSRHRFGETALAAYTLAHCGYDPEHAVVKKAVSFLRKRYRSLFKGDHWPQASSYSLSLTVLALHALFAREPADDPEDPDRARYGDSIRNRENPCQYPKWARKMIWQILDWMVENRAEQGLFRYPGGLPGGPPPPPGGGNPPQPFGFPGGMPARGPHFAGPEDLSNSQYVLLALWAGTRCGYEIDEETLEHMTRRLLAWQEAEGEPAERRPDPRPEMEGPGARYGNLADEPPKATDHIRGFGYTPGDEPTGSMTTAGLSSLVILKAIWLEQHGIPPELRREVDRGIWDAIAWLTWHYSIHGNPPRHGAMWHYYYLYGLERACVIAGKSHLGEHDWYREGAKLLVLAQREDGRWSPPNFLQTWAGPGGGPAYRMDLLDTCFALLFLKRATLTPKVPVLPEPVITPREREPRKPEEAR